MEVCRLGGMRAARRAVEKGAPLLDCAPLRIALRRKGMKERIERVMLTKEKASLEISQNLEDRTPYVEKNYDTWLDEWLSFRKMRVKESSYIRYRNMIDNHIRPYLGQCMIREIDTFSMEEYVSLLLKNGRLDRQGGLSVKSISDILTVVKESFRYAGAHGENITCCFEHICVKRKFQDMRVLSRREEGELVAFLLTDTDSYKLGVFLSLYTGIRIGELCALQWKDISLKDKTLRICKTMQRLHKLSPGENERTHIVISEPKSHMAKRLIPLPDFVLEVIEVFAGLPDAYVVAKKGKGYVEPRTMQNRFKQYVNLCGIEDINFHSLRHTFATRCVESGFDIKSLSEILGHSSVKITLDRYVHSSLEQKRVNMEKLKACYPG